MNKVILIGRLTRDPETRYSTTENGESFCITRYTLAVDRAKRKETDAAGQTADFIGCVALGKIGEFAEKYLKKGTKICVTGRIQTGSYTNKEGQKVYTTDVVVSEHEFCESKRGMSEEDKDRRDAAYAPSVDKDGFMSIPEGIDEELPFN